jgi:hypothetical protein
MSIPPDQRDDEQVSAAPQTPGVEETRYAPESRTPWYASTWVIAAGFAIFTVIFCIIGFIPYSETFMDYVQRPFRRPSLTAMPVETPRVVVSPATSIVETMPECVIVWVQHQPDDLGKKSRSKVWEQIVSDEVKASGMTPRKFYDLVLEHNPQLAEDDYEFKKGKTYLLPECQ